MTPESNDEIRQEQFKELLADPASGVTYETVPSHYKQLYSPRGPRSHITPGYSPIPTTSRSVPSKYKPQPILYHPRSPSEYPYS